MDNGSCIKICVKSFQKDLWLYLKHVAKQLSKCPWMCWTSSEVWSGTRMAHCYLEAAERDSAIDHHQTL